MLATVRVYVYAQCLVGMCAYYVYTAPMGCGITMECFSSSIILQCKQLTIQRIHSSTTHTCLCMYIVVDENARVYHSYFVFTAEHLMSRPALSSSASAFGGFLCVR